MCGPEEFDTINYKSPFSLKSPISANENTILDEQGILHFEPDYAGFLTVNVCVDEYRDGVLMTNFSRTASFISTLTTATAELPDASDAILLFPNPANDWITINSKYTDQIESVEVFSTDGSLRYRKGIEKDRIDLRGLNGGMYFVRFSVDKQRPIWKKVVISHSKQELVFRTIANRIYSVHLLIGSATK